MAPINHKEKMMIFFKQGTEAEANTKDKSVWKKRFALSPVCVSMDTNTGLKKYVWLELYEVRSYYEKDPGWLKEYRLPGSDVVWKVDDNCYDGM